MTKEFEWVGPLNRPFYIRPIDSAPMSAMSTEKKLFKLHFLLSGRHELACGGKTHVIDAPTVLCEGFDQGLSFHKSEGLIKTIYFHPGEVHEDFFERDPSDHRGFKGGAMMDQFYLHPFYIFNDLGFSRIAIDQDGLSRVQHQLELLDLEIDSKSFFWPCRSRSYFLELLILVRKLYDLGSQVTAWNALVLFIHTHYKEALTIEKLCHQFATNRTTLIQNFKKLTGQTLGDYIKTFRLTVASSLLRDTTLPIQEILERVGYFDLSHFNRSFKLKFGLSPVTYRKSHNWILPHFK